MQKIKGIAASTGIAIAKAYHLSSPDLTFEKRTINNPHAEINRLKKAIKISKEEITKIREKTEQELDQVHAEIFSAHLLVLSDPELFDPIIDNIKTNHLNAEAALDETANMFIKQFKNLDNEYMRERAADIEDVTKRVMRHL